LWNGRFGLAKFDVRVQPRGDAFARDLQDLPTLCFGLRRDVCERIRAIKIQIGLRERGRYGKARGSGIEPRCVGGRAHTVDQCALSAPEIEVPRETQGQIARPIRVAGQRRWIDVLLRVALPRHFARDDGVRLPRAHGGLHLRLRKVDYTDADLDAWLSRLRAAALKSAHVYFKHEDAATGPKLAGKFLERAA